MSLLPIDARAPRSSLAADAQRADLSRSMLELSINISSYMSLLGGDGGRGDGAYVGFCDVAAAVAPNESAPLRQRPSAVAFLVDALVHSARARHTVQLLSDAAPPAGMKRPAADAFEEREGASSPAAKRPAAAAPAASAPVSARVDAVNYKPYIPPGRMGAAGASAVPPPRFYPSAAAPGAAPAAAAPAAAAAPKPTGFISGYEGYARQQIAAGKAAPPPPKLGPKMTGGGGAALRDAAGGKGGDDPAAAKERLARSLAAMGRPTIGQRYRGDDGYEPVEPLPPHLENVSLDLCSGIEAEAYKGDAVAWSDIAGLANVKAILFDSVSLPLACGHLMGAGSLLEVPKGILLFGPPGTGKTMLAKAAASKCNARFFAVSASSITSKWHGEAEKNVRALFAVAVEYQPSIVFIDEIDSMLTQRTDKDDAVSGKIKTQFLIEMDGA